MTWQIIATPATLKGPGVLYSIDNSEGEAQRPEELHLLELEIVKVLFL